MVDPILERTDIRDNEPLDEYEPGQWGPAVATRIVTGGEGWHDPVPEKTTPC